MHYWLQQLQQKRWEYSNMRGSGQRDSWSSPTLAHPHTGLVGKDNGRQVRTHALTHSHIQWICYQSVISSYPGNNWKFTQALQITRVSRILLPSFCRKVFECFERVKVQIDIIQLVFCFKQNELWSKGAGIVTSRLNKYKVGSQVMVCDKNDMFICFPIFLNINCWEENNQTHLNWWEGNSNRRKVCRRGSFTSQHVRLTGSEFVINTMKAWCHLALYQYSLLQVALIKTEHCSYSGRPSWALFLSISIPLLPQQPSEHSHRCWLPVWLCDMSQSSHHANLMI